MLSHVFFNQILGLLIPDEEADMSDLVLEITAGVGGQEAMLFTSEVWSSTCIHSLKIILYLLDSFYKELGS